MNQENEQFQEPEFLSRADALLVHRYQIAEFGGGDGIRDAGALESALAQPQVTAGSVYVHDSLIAMAAAIIYHLSQNHPFLDGNKRTALAGGLVFLELNGIEVLDEEQLLYDLMIGVAGGSFKKSDVELTLRRLIGATHDR
ncbi:MAG: type II toxin-antitoxin system death-on-curing family toxin [Leptonema illini]|uniref:Type II toxin-antitoxin system death-on-curing family toxin n=1 Tax=Leptonema illini TaxID=183 RepID=A0A833H075_9LEPT|nr:MAG: type II toxin-antitoxin system death-on-curing family toxin [Leptonema illini]